MDYKQPLTHELASMFVRDYNALISLFGEEVVGKCLPRYTVGDFTTTAYARRDEGTDLYYAKQGYPVKNDRCYHDYDIYRTFGGKEYVAKERALSREYLVPSQYQSKAGDLLRDCLYEARPFLKTFDIDVYKLDGRTDNAEIYIKCESGEKTLSLYTPIKALLEGDWTAIEKRHTSYHREYYNPTRGKTEEEKQTLQGHLDRELAVLTSPTALRLKGYLDAKVTKPSAEDIEAAKARAQAKKQKKLISKSSKDYAVHYVDLLESWVDGYADSDSVINLLPQLREAIQGMKEKESTEVKAG